MSPKSPFVPPLLCDPFVCVSVFVVRSHLFVNMSVYGCVCVCSVCEASLPLYRYECVCAHVCRHKKIVIFFVAHLEKTTRFFFNQLFAALFSFFLFLSS